MTGNRCNVHLESWAGRSTVPAVVVRETPRFYRVRWLESRLGKPAGSTSLVPKDAVTFDGRAAELEEARS